MNSENKESSSLTTSIKILTSDLARLEKLKVHTRQASWEIIKRLLDEKDALK